MALLYHVQPWAGINDRVCPIRQEPAALDAHDGAALEGEHEVIGRARNGQRRWKWAWRRGEKEKERGGEGEGERRGESAHSGDCTLNSSITSCCPPQAAFAKSNNLSERRSKIELFFFFF